MNNLLNALNSKLDEAVLAFNVQNIYHLHALHQFANENNVEVIAQFSQRYFKQFDSLYDFKSLINSYKKKYVFFHLDHCSDFFIIQRCANLGFDGVMYDGSALNLEENINNTLKVKKMISGTDCIIEGEIGTLGGEEDGLKNKVNIVNINDAVKYYLETKVDLLALGIGNAHGFYTDTSKVDVSLLNKFNESIHDKVNLVLHGTSGLNDRLVHQAIKYGVKKNKFFNGLESSIN